MSVTVIDPQVILGPYPTLPVTANALDFAFEAADVGGGNAFLSTGREILLVRNTDSGSHTFTLTSVPDILNRTGDVTAYSLSAGEFAAFRFGATSGWKDVDGQILFSGSHATVEFAVLRLATSSS